MVVSFISTILSLIVFNLLFNNIFHDPIDLGVYVLSPIIVSKALAIVIISVLNFSIKRGLSLTAENNSNDKAS